MLILAVLVKHPLGLAKGDEHARLLALPGDRPHGEILGMGADVQLQPVAGRRTQGFGRRGVEVDFVRLQGLQQKRLAGGVCDFPLWKHRNILRAQPHEIDAAQAAAAGDVHNRR